MVPARGAAFRLGTPNSFNIRLIGWTLTPKLFAISATVSPAIYMDEISDGEIRSFRDSLLLDGSCFMRTL
jgi:hypothetical protein